MVCLYVNKFITVQEFKQMLQWQWHLKSNTYVSLSTNNRQDINYMYFVFIWLWDLSLSSQNNQKYVNQSSRSCYKMGFFSYKPIPKI